MSTMKAVFVEGNTQEIKEFPIPEPGPGRVLIKVVCAAQNPKDWKIGEHFGGPGVVQGSDVSGVVVKVGEGVTRFKPGDRVAGTFRTGAFAEYASYPELSTFHIPGTLTFEEACTIPLGLTTAAMGIYRRLGYPLDKPITERKTIIVWGASGSVGQYAIQLAKLVGLRVIGVAGAGAPVAKISGCDLVVDYREGQTLAQIKQALGDEQLQYGFDAVSEPPTTSQLASLIAPTTKDAKVVMVLYPHEPLPTHIQYLQTSVFSIYGEEVRHGANVVPAMPEDTEFAKRFFPALEGWLREGGKIIPNKITIVEGGLEGVREGFRRMREKEVSGEKLVFRIAETPGVEAH